MAQIGKDLDLSQKHGLSPPREALLKPDKNHAGSNLGTVHRLRELQRLAGNGAVADLLSGHAGATNSSRTARVVAGDECKETRQKESRPKRNERRPRVQRMTYGKFSIVLDEMARIESARLNVNASVWRNQFLAWFREDYISDLEAGFLVSRDRSLARFILRPEFTRDALKEYVDRFARQGTSLVESMEAMALGGHTWGGGYLPIRKANPAEARKPFAQWLAGGEEPKVLNCWEAVLFAAHHARWIDFVTKEYITHAIYRRNAAVAPALVRTILSRPVGKAIASGSGKELFVRIPLDILIPEGHLVIFGGNGEHVAVSTGDLRPIEEKSERQLLKRDLGHGILELDHFGKEMEGVVYSTVEDAISRKRSSYGGQQVAWGPLPGPLVLRLTSEALASERKGRGGV